ncbi:hypothetical protein BGZ76_008252 [Entomortierella beljakovae]|nr:hypothetical protein BGZ76_008252 [Entomortierella beljakovae]
MTTTLRSYPQLRIIRSSQTSEEDDDDDTGNGSSEPPSKIRKKPGRKPNPASPAVRKEQNRAAQRAFRDRKERHLQEMEETIKVLRETNAQITQRLQKDTQQFKSSMDTLKGENYYLRQVVFSFETALNKGGNITILQEVKTELYRRHYEKHTTTTKRLLDTTPEPESRPPQTISSSFLPESDFAILLRQEQANRSASHANANIDTNVNTNANPSTSSTSSTSSKSAIPLTAPIPPSPQSSLSDPPTSSSSHFTIKDSPISSWNSMDSDDETIFSMNNDILYKAPPLYCVIDTNGGKLLKSFAPCDFPPASQRPVFTEAGAFLAKQAEYNFANKSVFDELQSSLFPPGTLQSIIHAELSSPMDIVNDTSMLDQLHNRRPLRDPVIAPGRATSSGFLPAADVPSPRAPTSILDDENNDFEITAPSLGLDAGLKQNVFPSIRLQNEIQVLASALPAVDPNIDAKIYALPHDLRIDLIPCPKLRAQLILHQKRLDLEDLCELLVNGARCHGHPLDPHSWELPDEFFERYGFLLGEEMLRHRNKVWPKKDEPTLQESYKAY